MKKKAAIPLHVRSFPELRAEFLGTFMVTYVTMWSVIYNDLDALSQTGVALCHTVVVLVTMWFMYKISGAHFNPALTLGMIFVRKIDWLKGLYYIASQFLGALLAAILIYIQLTDRIFAQIKHKSILGIPYAYSEGNTISEFFGEILGTFFLVYVYMSIVAYKSKTKSQEIGIMAFSFSIFAITMTFGELSGACLNPARSLSSSIVVGAISKNQFYQIFGPILGSILGSMTYSFLYIDEDDEDNDEAVEAPTKPYTKK